MDEIVLAELKKMTLDHANRIADLERLNIVRRGGEINPSWGPLPWRWDRRINSERRKWWDTRTFKRWQGVYRERGLCSPIWQDSANGAYRAPERRIKPGGRLWGDQLCGRRTGIGRREHDKDGADIGRRGGVERRAVLGGVMHFVPGKRHSDPPWVNIADRRSGKDRRK